MTHQFVLEALDASRRAACDCGWTGPWHSRREVAIADGRQHGAVHAEPRDYGRARS